MTEQNRPHEIPRKTLGKTEIEVTTVGIGTAFIGMRTTRNGTTARHLDEELALRTVWAALEEGVRLIDTAALYLDSEAERIVGRALRERPDLAEGVVLETKCCRLPHGSDYSYDAALRSVEGSLDRLGVKRVELMYIHDPVKEAFDQVMGKGGALEALRRLQAEGVVGHIGMASNRPYDNAPFIETGEFEMAVVPHAYSLLNRVALERIFPAAERFGMGVVIATPFGGGGGLLATGVRAARWDELVNRFTPESVAQTERIESLCDRYGVSLLAAALQYVTRHPVVATTIPGSRSPDESIANARAAREPIPEAFWDELTQLIMSAGTFAVERRP